MSVESTSENPLEISGSLIVKMEVSGGYYGAVGETAEYFLKTHCANPDGSLNIDRVKEVNAQIESDNITEEWVNHYKTMLIFIYEFERIARKEGKLKEPEKLS